MGETYIEDGYWLVLDPGMEPWNSDMPGSLTQKKMLAWGCWPSGMYKNSSTAVTILCRPKEIACVYKRSIDENFHKLPPSIPPTHTPP